MNTTDCQNSQDSRITKEEFERLKIGDYVLLAYKGLRWSKECLACNGKVVKILKFVKSDIPNAKGALNSGHRYHINEETIVRQATEEEYLAQGFELEWIET